MHGTKMHLIREQGIARAAGSVFGRKLARKRAFELA